MASSAPPPPQPPSNNNRGGGRGAGNGGGGGRGRGSGGAAPPLHHDTQDGNNGPPRVSALGNPLPPIKKTEGPPTVKKELPPTVAVALPAASASAPKPAMTPITKLERNPNAPSPSSGKAPPPVASSPQTPQSQTKLEGAAASKDPKKKYPQGAKSGGGQAIGLPPPLAVPQDPIAVPPPQSHPAVQQQPPQQRPQRQTKPQIQPIQKTSNSIQSKSSPEALPETLNSSHWGDDAEESVSQEVVETRLRTQLDRAKQEKTSLQKQLTALQAELEKAQTEAAKSKTDAEQLKTQIEKVATVEKSYASLRQTRDALETERDALKKGLLKAEKDLQALKETTQKRITKLEVDLDAVTAQVEYQKLEIEEARTEVLAKQARIAELEVAMSSSGLGIPVPRPPATAIGVAWVYSCLPGSNVSQIADALSFSNLEMSLVNAGTWSEADETGFRKSVATAVFERCGQSVNADSPEFEAETREALVKCLQTTEMLLFVPANRTHLSSERYGHYVSRLVQLIADARDLARNGARASALLLEDYPYNRVVIRQGTKAIPVNLVA